MGDGAKAMCWSHVHHNIVPRLKSIATIDKSLSEKICLNIMDIQWSSLNEAIFSENVSVIGEEACWET